MDVWSQAVYARAPSADDVVRVQPSPLEAGPGHDFMFGFVGSTVLMLVVVGLAGVGRFVVDARARAGAASLAKEEDGLDDPSLKQEAGLPLRQEAAKPKLLPAPEVGVWM